MHTRARSLDVVVGVAFIKLLSNMVGSASFSTWAGGHLLSIGTDDQPNMLGGMHTASCTRTLDYPEITQD